MTSYLGRHSRNGLGALPSLVLPAGGPVAAGEGPPPGHGLPEAVRAGNEPLGGWPKRLVDLAFAILGDLSWVAPATYAVAWIGLLLITRYSSLAGMTAGLLSPLAAAILLRFDLALLFLGLALLVLWKHRANLDRLIAGTEPRVGARSNG